MSLQLRAFRPLSATQNLAVTASAQTVTFNNLNGTRAVRMTNKGVQDVFITFDGTTSTTTTGMILPAGATEVFTLGNDVTSISVIANGTGSTLYTTIGEGV